MARRARRIASAAVLAISGCLLLGASCDGPRTPTYLIIGQSNAVGSSSQVTGVASGLSYSATQGRWFEPIQDPWVHGVLDGKPRGSPWPSFAFMHGEPIQLVAAAVGGTCLLDWTAFGGKPSSWNPQDGYYYARAYDAWIDAGAPPLRAALWHQGECDGGQGSTYGADPAVLQAAYKQALFDLADAVAQDYGVPLVAAPVSLQWCTWDNVTCDPLAFRPPDARMVPISNATLEAALEHPNIEFGPEHSDLRLMPDQIHVFDVFELGLRWFERVQALP